MTKIKCCGIQRKEEIDLCNRVHPDQIGFVFAPNSKRVISFQQARVLKNQLDPTIQVIGVFVDASIEQIITLVDQGILDGIQLHGTENGLYIQALKDQIKVPVWKAFCLKTKEDVYLAQESGADMVLLDAGKGEGKRFDWHWLSLMDRPYYLAGGLDSSNVKQAIRSYHPYGVDVSSGIETYHRKDLKKMQAFVESVRKEDEV